MQPITLICLVLSAVAFQSSIARPDGAPVGACQTLTPGHPSPPQTGRSPYSVVPAALTVNRGQPLSVSLRTRGTPITGFILQARDASAPNRIVGQFVRSVDPRWKLMNCAGAVGNSATHTAPLPKFRVTLQWRAPADFTGRVIFK